MLLVLLFLALGFLLGFAWFWVGLPMPRYDIEVMLLVMALLLLETRLIEHHAEQHPWLNQLRLNGVHFGFGSAGLGMAWLLLLRLSPDF